MEEAYRRKCIQLKQRTNEVEEANDAARLRLMRLKRQVEKMRLERAFLLEQLAKRTSTNVEDSDGSPSPPPTVSSQPDDHHHHHRALATPSASTRANATPPPQPKDKPLRIKRGHRKPSVLASLEAAAASSSSLAAAVPGSTFIGQNAQQTQSPGSDAFSASAAGKTNGLHGTAPPPKPRSAFELYCDDHRDSLIRQEKDREGGGDDAGDAGAAVEEELSRGWTDLPEGRRDEYQARADRQTAEYEKEKAAYDSAKARDGEDAGGASRAESDGNPGKAESEQPAAERTPGRPEREDVEMANDDTDQETQGELRPEE